MAAVSVGNLCKHKVVLLGADRVGKSALVATYLYGACDAKYQSTVGVEFHSKSVYLPSAVAQPPATPSCPALPWDPISLQLWDCSGHERFQTIVPTYVRGAQAVLVVYSVVSRTSFAASEDYVKLARKEAGDSVTIFLVGTQADRGEERTVTGVEGEALAQALGCYHLEASAMDSPSVSRCFRTVTSVLVRHTRRDPPWNEIPLVHPGPTPATPEQEADSCLGLLLASYRGALAMLSRALGRAQTPLLPITHSEQAPSRSAV